MDKEQEYLADTLRYYGMPEENIETCINQIAQGYGASRYLDGVANGADAVAEMKPQIWFDARTTLPEDDGSEILCLEEGGYARIGRGKVLGGTTKWAYIKALEKIS